MEQRLIVGHVNSYTQICMMWVGHVKSYMLICMMWVGHVNSYMLIGTYHTNLYKRTHTYHTKLRLACIHVVWHDGFCSFWCLSESKNKSRAGRRSRLPPFFGRTTGAGQRGLVNVHGLVTLFLEVIPLATILLVIGLAVPCVPVIASTMIMVLIVQLRWLLWWWSG